MLVYTFFIGLVASFLLLIFQNQYPSLFSESEQVKALVYDLTPLLAFSVVINSIQPALSGVVIGAGWQALVANVNIICYYVFGIPLGLLLGYTLDYGVKVSIHHIHQLIMIMHAILINLTILTMRSLSGHMVWNGNRNSCTNSHPIFHCLPNRLGQRGIYVI